MNAAPKLIIALDFNNQTQALTLIDALDPQQCALKVGFEMYTLLGMNFVRTLINKNFNVFLDLKFHDIPNTVARACACAADMGVWMLTLHASGGTLMMQAALNAIKPFGVNRPKLVAVTVLTSTGASDLLALGITTTLQDHVCMLAQLAHTAGLDGVVSSALDVARIKSICGKDFLAITPGIRRLCDSTNDQQRIVTPEFALKSGSDYLVVGRPITRAENPAETARDFMNIVCRKDCE